MLMLSVRRNVVQRSGNRLALLPNANANADVILDRYLIQLLFICFPNRSRSCSTYWILPLTTLNRGRFGFDQGLSRSRLASMSMGLQLQSNISFEPCQQ